MSGTEHATDNFPIVTWHDGQPLIGCDAALALIRSIAAVVEKVTDSEDADNLAEAIRIEADNLEVRAIAHTRAGPQRRP